MPNNSRTWLLIGFIALIVIGIALIALPIPNAPPSPGTPTSVPATEVSTAPSNVPYPDVIRVTVGNARAAYDLKQAVFVDVRTKEQYDQSHIPGALSLPLSVFEEQLSKLNAEQWIITYCT